VADEPRTVDEIPWGDAPEPRVATAKPRKCSHPKQYRRVIDWCTQCEHYYQPHPLQCVCPHVYLDGNSSLVRVPVCDRCGHRFDPARVAQGRRNLRRGKDAERRVAKAMSGRRTGQFGGADDVQALFAVQVKAGPTYWPKALARLLEDQRLAAAALGRAGPAVAFVETGNLGRRNRVIVAVYADDLERALRRG
jgi:hypothetical protein